MTTALRAVTRQREYDIVVGRGSLAQLGSLMADRLPQAEAVICTDDNVGPLYLAGVHAILANAGFAVSEIVIPAGEAHKNTSRVYELYGVLYDRGIRRRDCLVALGGGVVGDLVGLCAATYQRGLHFVQVPTTLLAQVDASVGGKTGVDFRAGKNYVGAFYQPHLVCADLDTLNTLPERELRCGLAEVAKYGFAFAGDVLAECEALAGRQVEATSISEALVAACVRHKIEVVAADEREESGQRALLNLGHTLGHAIEAATGFRRYSHGEAVALGLRGALWLSRRCCELPLAEFERGMALLDGLGLPKKATGVSPAMIVDLVRRDKKAGASGVGFVLLERLGRPLLNQKVDDELIAEAAAWLT